MTTVAALFVRADSHYKTMAGVECYDMERDARTYDGPWPVVAHPPCRAWGRLRTFANPRPDERNLARLAVAMVREWGGYWSTRKAQRFGRRRSSQLQVSAMPSEAGRWQRRRSGGATKPKRRHGSMSSAASPATRRQCPCSLEMPPLSCRAESAMTTAHTSPKQSASTRRPSWPNGWSSWPADALHK